MVDEPESIYAEPYRILRTNLDLARLGGTAKTFMVTSAVEGEGKSTTVANLAVAAARGGQDVILVDLDSAIRMSALSSPRRAGTG